MGSSFGRQAREDESTATQLDEPMKTGRFVTNVVKDEHRSTGGEPAGRERQTPGRLNLEQGNFAQNEPAMTPQRFLQFLKGPPRGPDEGKDKQTVLRQGGTAGGRKEATASRSTEGEPKDAFRRINCKNTSKSQIDGSGRVAGRHIKR